MKLFFLTILLFLFQYSYGTQMGDNQGPSVTINDNDLKVESGRDPIESAPFSPVGPKQFFPDEEKPFPTNLFPIKDTPDAAPSFQNPYINFSNGNNLDRLLQPGETQTSSIPIPLIQEKFDSNKTLLISIFGLNDFLETNQLTRAETFFLSQLLKQAKDQKNTHSQLLERDSHGGIYLRVILPRPHDSFFIALTKKLKENSIQVIEEFNPNINPALSIFYQSLSCQLVYSK